LLARDCQLQVHYCLLIAKICIDPARSAGIFAEIVQQSGKKRGFAEKTIKRSSFCKKDLVIDSDLSIMRSIDSDDGFGNEEVKRQRF